MNGSGKLNKLNLLLFGKHLTKNRSFPVIHYELYCQINSLSTDRIFFQGHNRLSKRERISQKFLQASGFF